MRIIKRIKNMRNIYKYKIFVGIALIWQSFGAFSQSVSIKEEVKMIDTYSFDSPNPVPILSENPKIHPYFKFKGYAHNSVKKPWKVVTLENDYIKVFVLPEIGGKVWGAIDKKSGEEFLYKNKVIKFRNISMRGPWTSGGIEFNFGIIGHHPGTSTPVDYLIKNNADGSLSCIVGNTDLPSNSQWRVEINLQKDKAYFETKASWYNASPLNQSYYNWMTAAAVATDDLEFFIPGDEFLKHNGDAEPWPIDVKNRNLSMYRNNNFGPAKSYHIVGDYKDFFGGYYHDRKFGFGHWSPYEEMPGQKLWLWALSRSGGIWEDLLTDVDGQYIEFQAGRLLNQYSPGEATNPISQANFDPYVMDIWREIWFPYNEIGGMVDASEYGVLNVEQKNNELYIGINALQTLNENLKVLINGEEVFHSKLELEPMEVFSKVITAKSTDVVEVSLGKGILQYSSDKSKTLIKRPFHSDKDLKISRTEQLYSEGWEAMKFREFDLANKKLSELIAIDPSHQMGLVRLAELEYRKTNYKKALEFANQCLRIDTYNSGANYIAGITYRAINDAINALESFGWAARDMKYRSVSYTQMAEVYISLNNIVRAKEYAIKALDFNTYNLNARHVLLILARKQQDNEGFKRQSEVIKNIDALDIFTAIESEFLHNKGMLNVNSIAFLHNEFSEEILLEQAIKYNGLGLRNEAVNVLNTNGNGIKNKLWLAYLLRNTEKSKSNQILIDALNESAEFVLPFRPETIPVLEWAESENPHWKFKYYLAQNYLSVGRIEKGKNLLVQCKNEPDWYAFYRFRAKMLDKNSYSDQLMDYQRAYEINNSDWMVWDDLIQFYLLNKNYNEAYKFSMKASKKFPKNYNIGLSYAKSSLKVKDYNKSISILKDIQVLPFEHASESRIIYENAHILYALENIQKEKYKKAKEILINSKKWPENIGVGKPYEPDERIQNFLLAYCYEKLNDQELSEQLLRDIVSYTSGRIETQSLNHLFGLMALDKLGNKDALNETIRNLRGLDGHKKPKNLYVLALYQGDKVKQAKLKSDLNIEIEEQYIIENLPID